MRLRYAGHPKPVRTTALGTAGWEELTDGAIVAAQPHGAPSWFPCNDRPSNKATYRISVTAPTDYRVVSNGRRWVSDVGSRASTWRFDQAEPMATYLATVHVGRYEVRAMSASVPTSVVMPRRSARKFDEIFGRQPEMVDTFTDAVRRRTRSPAYTVVVTDDDLEMPLEAQGAVHFRRQLPAAGLGR